MTARERAFAISAIALVACTKSGGPEPDANHLTVPSAAAAIDAAVEAPCVVPAAPRHLVLRATRHVLPIGRDVSIETGAIAASAADCAGKEQCRVVSQAKLEAALVKVRAALAVRHRADVRMSPHYGGRFVEAAWEGGKCETGDSSQSAVTQEDMRMFDDGLAAIVNAYVEADAGAK